MDQIRERLSNEDLLPRCNNLARRIGPFDSTSLPVNNCREGGGAGELCHDTWRERDTRSTKMANEHGALTFARRNLVLWRVRMADYAYGVTGDYLVQWRQCLAVGRSRGLTIGDISKKSGRVSKKLDHLFNDRNAHVDETHRYHNP